MAKVRLGANPMTCDKKLTRLFSSFIQLFFLLLLPFHALRFRHARNRARGDFWQPPPPPSQDWFTVLAYFSALYFNVLSFLCLCLLEAPRCPGLLVRGATGGLPALRGACFAALVPFSWLPVRAGPEPLRPVRPEKTASVGRGGGVCSFSEKKNDRMSHFFSVCFIFFLFFEWILSQRYLHSPNISQQYVYAQLCTS